MDSAGRLVVCSNEGVSVFWIAGRSSGPGSCFCVASC